jgi:hypothetical protein
MDEDVLTRILNPAPGSALARARDYGIDLTLLARNIALTHDERLQKAERNRRMARALREMREANKH